MGSTYHVVAASLIGNRKPALAVGAAIVCISFLPGSLRAQSFSACGSNICASSGANVGIGTIAPTDKLEAVGGNGSMIKSTSVQSGSNNWSGVQLKSWVSNATETWDMIGGSLTGGGSLFWIRNNSVPRLVITYDGNVGIGTTVPQSKLAVNGTITTKEVIVTNTGWADYVLRPDYSLRPLNEVAAYISANHHLPDIPSAAEVLEKGVSLGEMQVKLLAKIEELTLHMIQADERNDRLEEQNREMREKFAELEARDSRSQVEANHRATQKPNN